MRISNIRSNDSPTDETMFRVSADVACDEAGESETLWFDVPQFLREYTSSAADPWLAALLPLAAKLGEDIWIDGEVDTYLLESVQELQEWWRFWFPDYSVNEVHATASVSQSSGPEAATAQFFSGGVDSFFTLLRHVESGHPIEVDDLLIGWGFDIPLADAGPFERVRATLDRVAREMGKRLVPFATNFRETSLKKIPWGEVGHGNAMAAIALLLQNAYGRVLVPSTDGYRESGPWGSHATTDHLYSSSRMRIVHDGAAFTRFEKVELVAQSVPALSALRVCWRRQSDENCGQCEKCLRTMIALELCGVLGKAKTFSHAALDVADIAKIYCPHTDTGPFDLYYEEMRDAALLRGHSAIAGAISKALTRSRIKQPILNLTERLSWNRYLGPIGRPVDAALRRTIII